MAPAYATTPKMRTPASSAPVGPIEAILALDVPVFHARLMIRVFIGPIRVTDARSGVAEKWPGTRGSPGATPRPDLERSGLAGEVERQVRVLAGILVGVEVVHLQRSAGCDGLTVAVAEVLT